MNLCIVDATSGQIYSRNRALEKEELEQAQQEWETRFYDASSGSRNIIDKVGEGALSTIFLGGMIAGCTVAAAVGVGAVATVALGVAGGAVGIATVVAAAKSSGNILDKVGEGALSTGFLGGMVAGCTVAATTVGLNTAAVVALGFTGAIVGVVAVVAAVKGYHKLKENLAEKKISDAQRNASETVSKDTEKYDADANLRAVRTDKNIAVKHENNNPFAVDFRVSPR